MDKQNLIRSLSGTASALALVWTGSVGAVSMDVGDTTLNVGGYVKLDAIYNVDEDLGDTAFFRGLTVPDTGVVEGSSRFHARQSRLDITTSTSVGGDELFTRIQADFFGGGGNEIVSNSRSLRIRHAYGQWRGILAGQTWSNFQPLVFAPTVDFGGPAGYIFNRQAQIRYTVGDFSVSLENPESNLVNNVDARNSNDPWPDITARLAGNHGSGVYSLSAVATQLEVDDGSNDDSTSGFGVNAAGTWTAGNSTVGGQLGFYDGANRYLWQTGVGGGGFNNGYVAADGDVETIEEIGAMIFLDHGLSPSTKLGLTLGWIDTDSDSTTASLGNTSDEALTTVHANLRWSPAPAITYAGEIQWGQREFFNDQDADGSRVQFSAQYNF